MVSSAEFCLPFCFALCTGLVGVLMAYWAWLFLQGPAGESWLNED